MKRKCNYRPEVFTCTKILREMKNRKGSKKKKKKSGSGGAYN